MAELLQLRWWWVSLTILCVPGSCSAPTPYHIPTRYPSFHALSANVNQNKSFFPYTRFYQNFWHRNMEVTNTRPFQDFRSLFSSPKSGFWLLQSKVLATILTTAVKNSHHGRHIPKISFSHKTTSNFYPVMFHIALFVRGGHMLYTHAVMSGTFSFCHFLMYDAHGLHVCGCMFVCLCVRIRMDA